MTQIELVSVVLVHWNQAERCVATVAAFRAQEEVTAEIVVVDNGSSPDQLAVLHAIDGVKVIELRENTGFGPGANVGWRYWLGRDAGDWCVVAPHDALPAKDCLARMLAALDERPLAGLACADVGDGQTPVVDRYFGGMTLPGYATEGWEAAGYPHGTLMVARRRCLEEIGLFDERYFAYCEEADLGERARRAGWEVGIVRGARVTNPYLGGGSDLVDYLMLRNTLLLVRKQFGWYPASVRFVIALMHLARGSLDPSSRPWIFAPAARVRALADFSRGRFGPPPASLTPGRVRSTRSSRTPAARRSTRRR